MADLLRRSDASPEAALEELAVLLHDPENLALLRQELRSVTTQWQTLESQLKERQTEWASSQEVIKQLTATLPLVEQQLTIYKSLFDKRLVGLNEYLALEEENCGSTTGWNLKNRARPNWARPSTPWKNRSKPKKPKACPTF